MKRFDTVSIYPFIASTPTHFNFGLFQLKFLTFAASHRVDCYRHSMTLFDRLLIAFSAERLISLRQPRGRLGLIYLDNVRGRALATLCLFVAFSALPNFIPLGEFLLRYANCTDDIAECRYAFFVDLNTFTGMWFEASTVLHNVLIKVSVAETKLKPTQLFSARLLC